MPQHPPSHPGFTKLYQEHHAWLVRWLSHKTWERDAAQDLAQDTFIKLLNHNIQQEPLTNPRAWLAKIAGNLAIDRARRQILERNYLELLANIPELEHPSAEHQFELIELLNRVDVLLDGLRSIEKKAFLMSRLDGMTYREIAAALHISNASVEKYMAKAMLICYRAMYPLEGE